MQEIRKTLASVLNLLTLALSSLPGNIGQVANALVNAGDALDALEEGITTLASGLSEGSNLPDLPDDFEAAKDPQAVIRHLDTAIAAAQGALQQVSGVNEYADFVALQRMRSAHLALQKAVACLEALAGVDAVNAQMAERPADEAGDDAIFRLAEALDWELAEEKRRRYQAAADAEEEAPPRRTTSWKETTRRRHQWRPRQFSGFALR